MLPATMCIYFKMLAPFSIHVYCVIVKFNLQSPVCEIDVGKRCSMGFCIETELLHVQSGGGVHFSNTAQHMLSKR